MERRNEGRQDRVCSWCGVYENVTPITEHHIWPRSVRPDLIDDPKNKLLLCSICHQLTEDDMGFMFHLQAMYYPNPDAPKTDLQPREDEDR